MSFYLVTCYSCPHRVGLLNKRVLNKNASPNPWSSSTPTTVLVLDATELISRLLNKSNTQKHKSRRVKALLLRDPLTFWASELFGREWEYHTSQKFLLIQPRERSYWEARLYLNHRARQMWNYFSPSSKKMQQKKLKSKKKLRNFFIIW